MNCLRAFQVVFISIAVLAILTSPKASAAVIQRSFGGDASTSGVTSILATRDLFRSDLGGGTIAGANGSFGGLRREINWDGVPAASSAPNSLASNFFNVNSPRGAVFSSPGTGFQVSNAGAGQPALANFGNINASYSNEFGVFSAQRLFTALGSNIMDVNFFQAGTNTTATVSGFGSIFTDVDLLGSTSIQYFDQVGASLGVFNVPVGTVSSGSLSFLGVSFNAGERIGRVRITSGNAALGAGINDGGATDLVVMDDFIYSEPMAVPEPSTFGMFGLASLLLLCRRFRNQKARIFRNTRPAEFQN